MKNKKMIFYIEFNNLCYYKGKRKIKSWNCTIDNDYIFKIDIEFTNCYYKDSIKLNNIKKLKEKEIKEYAKKLFEEITNNSIINNY